MSARRSLVEHLLAEHSSDAARKPGTIKRASQDELAKMHSYLHHHYRDSLTHYHAGENRGPAARPAGWKTGLGVVAREP